MSGKKDSLDHSDSGYVDLSNKSPEKSAFASSTFEPPRESAAINIATGE